MVGGAHVSACVGWSAAASDTRPTTMADYQQGRQLVVDRLKRRVDSYRTEHNNVANHLDRTYPVAFEQEHRRTLSLKQRHVEAKNKKNNKKDKKLETPLSNMGVS